MTNRRSEQSNDKPESRSYSVDYRDPEHPARTRITTAYEVIREAMEDLPLIDQSLACLELERRFKERSRELIRKLSKQARSRIQQRGLWPGRQDEDAP